MNTILDTLIDRCYKPLWKLVYTMREDRRILVTKASMTTPIYRRIARALISRISEGDLRPGSRVPSERELATEYGTSRMTARAAVQLLAQRGLVERKERSGVFVARPKIEQGLDTVAGFYDQMRSRGVVPGAEVIDARTIRARELDSGIATHLELAGEDLVHEVVRRRTGDGEPLALEESYFPTRLFPELLDNDLTSSIYGLLRDRYGISPARSRQEIEPTQLDSKAAATLGARPDVPALSVTRTTWDMDGQPIEFARDLYRGDRLLFVTETDRTSVP
jgi:GntR family transcriptional regulator